MQITKEEPIRLRTECNMKFGEKLTQLRKAAGYSQQEVAAMISKRLEPITNRAVSKWETGATYPDAMQFIWLCEIYGVADVASTFLGIVGSDPFAGLNREGANMLRDYAGLLRLSPKSSEAAPASEAKRPMRVVPLYDLPVSAGTGVFLDSDNFEPFESDEVPPEANFAVRISGDSMEPLLKDGQIVFVQSATSLEQGEIGIFIYDGNAYCKKLDRENGVKLVSLNPRYNPINVKRAYDLRVVGRVITGEEN